SGIGSQRPKGSLADWVSSIANFAAAFLSVITVGLIVIGASLTVRQWVEARRTADASVAAVEESIRANAANSKDSDRAYGLSREALEDVQRAFVYAEPVMVAMPNENGSVEKFTLGAKWVNSGETPTKGLTQHVSYAPLAGSLPDKFPFPKLWQQGVQQIDEKTFIAPKGGLQSTETVVVSRQTLEEMLKENANIYM